MPTHLQVGGEEFNTVPLRLVQPKRIANRQLLAQECALDSEAHSYMLELSSRPDPLQIGLFHSHSRIPHISNHPDQNPIVVVWFASARKLTMVREGGDPMRRLVKYCW
jgi:hypothetical protein